MSRLRRLKEKNRMQMSKIAMSSLTITLIIGLCQTISTYAWFIDSEEIKSDLVISMGEINVEVNDGFQEKDLEAGNLRSCNFKIENEGTLKSHITLNLDGISKNIEQYLNYKINFGSYKNKEIKSISGKELLDNSQVSLEYKDGSLVELNGSESIEAIAEINIDKDTPKNLMNYFSKSPLKFKLKVLASQANNKYVVQNKGFYDVDTQENSLLFKGIVNSEIPSSGNFDVKLVANATRIEIWADWFKSLISVDFVKGNGTFGKNTYLAEVQNKNRIDITCNNCNINITSTEFNDNDAVVLKLITKNNDIKYMKVMFRKLNGVVEAKFNIYDTIPGFVETSKKEGEVSVEIPNEPDEVKPPNEEVEEPSEPDIVKPPNEEVEMPSKLDIVDSPVLPSEPDITEPSKEGIEIQE